jgi:hypothetical protein
MHLEVRNILLFFSFRDTCILQVYTGFAYKVFNLHLALHVKFYMCNLPDNIILTILPLSYANLKSLTQKLCGLVNRDANQRPSTTRQGSSRLRAPLQQQMYLKRHDISIQKKTYVACTRGETERFDKDAVDEPC